MTSNISRKLVEKLNYIKDLNFSCISFTVYLILSMKIYYLLARIELYSKSSVTCNCLLLLPLLIEKIIPKG